MRTFEGNYNTDGLKIAIVISRFNSSITKELLDGALDALKRHEVKNENIDVFWTPGAMEIPFIVKKVVAKSIHDAVIVLGAVIRGETYHFNVVANEVAKGIASINLNGTVPVTFGVVTTDTIEQALNRSGVKLGNKGFDAAMTAIEMSNLKKQIEEMQPQEN